MAIKVLEKAKKVLNPRGARSEAKKANDEANKSIEEAPKKPNLVTTRPVEFVVNSVKFSGTSFHVPADSLLERQNDLRSNYGDDIIAEE